MIDVNDTIAIREDEIRLEFVQASGPGGQNVNKVASRVQLRFNIQSPSLPEEVRTRLAQIARKRINDDGVLLIDAGRYRTQEQNRLDAINRLIELIRKATEKPKLRRATRPTRVSVQKRLESKRRRSETKLNRRRIDQG